MHKGCVIVEAFTALPIGMNVSISRNEPKDCAKKWIMVSRDSGDIPWIMR